MCSFFLIPVLSRFPVAYIYCILSSNQPRQPDCDTRLNILIKFPRVARVLFFLFSTWHVLIPTCLGLLDTLTLASYSYVKHERTGDDEFLSFPEWPVDTVPLPFDGHRSSFSITLQRTVSHHAVLHRAVFQHGDSNLQPTTSQYAIHQYTTPSIPPFHELYVSAQASSAVRGTSPSQQERSHEQRPYHNITRALHRTGYLNNLLLLGVKLHSTAI